MSLLMDALKKAEEEKKRATKRLQDVEIDARETTGEHNISDLEQVAVAEEDSIPELYTDTSQFSLESLSLEERFEEIKETATAVEETHHEVEVASVDVSESFSEDLTLESTISAGESSQETFEETQEVIDLNDSTIIEGLSTESVVGPFDDTFHGVLFEEEEPDTDVYEETLLSVRAEQLAKDLGGGRFQPTPVAAKTVFSAGRPNKTKSSFKWAVFVVLGLLAVGSLAIFYYFTITPVSRKMPSPLIAHSAEYEVITETISKPIVEETTVGFTEEIVEIESQSIVEQAVENSSVIEEDVLQQETVVETITEPVENEIAEAASVDETVVVDESTDVVTSNAREQKLLPEKIQIDASLINISKSKNVLKENAMVNQAFKAYQDGHYDAAKSIYEDVLKSDSDNRDAHLGLAAIAISDQDRKTAYTHYIHLLELNPGDTLAMNALIGLSNSADPVKDESAIKLLIQGEGDLPYLYFSLGNLYAKQKRWANAQQAFFDAYRLDTTNADYVLNLAISLDRIGQYDAALDYYKTAIDLSRNSSTTFDSVPVNNRILALSKLLESNS